MIGFKYGQLKDSWGAGTDPQTSCDKESTSAELCRKNGNRIWSTV